MAARFEVIQSWSSLPSSVEPSLDLRLQLEQRKTNLVLVDLFVFPQNQYLKEQLSMQRLRQ
ncbi:hypothetical protein P5673_029903 [Acropora cervicornis]|uniref:Uncharacterized protein n=1 Tax=Acropora cervicornis TaxID=6130 RepID=A0AAD9UU06_ACRCE|nr:hypothetical protein P5673_029903 [Acropora cervicornis]